MHQERILVTGATGFVGQALCAYLLKHGHSFSAVVRQEGRLGGEIPTILVPNLNKHTDLSSVLSDVDVLIHLAGRAHVMHETEADAYAAYASVNIDLTQHLINSAKQAGIKRVVFLSTTKVNGEFTVDKPFTEQDQLNPVDDYAKTKMEAERIIQEGCANNDMEYVIIRPPLVYGPKVKANFKRLMALSVSRWPLPFGAINNLRSFVYLENLVDFIGVCIRHPQARNQTFFVSDGQDISTKTLIQIMAATKRKKTWLIPIPEKLIHTVLIALKPTLYQRVCANFQISIDKAKTMLNWKPPFTIKEAIDKTMSSHETDI